MKEFTKNESFKVNGSAFTYADSCRRNGGLTHIWAMRTETNKKTCVAIANIDAEFENENERYTAFKNNFGGRKNHEFMFFISTMVGLYTGSDNLVNNTRGIVDHDDFTKFIHANAHRHTL